jgi:hypothetical protein
LAELPKAPSGDPFSEVLNLLSGFLRDLERHLEGIPEKDGLLQAVGPSYLEFKKAIRATAPEFLPYERIRAGSLVPRKPQFLDNEEEPPASDPVGEEEVETIQFAFAFLLFIRIDAYLRSHCSPSESGSGSEEISSESSDVIYRDDTTIYIDEVLERAKKCGALALVLATLVLNTTV